MWLQETQLLRDAYIKESRLFMYIFNNSDILSDLGRFLCVNVYFGTSIHHILFFVSNHAWLTRNMVNKTEKSVEFKKGIFSTHN